jgi:hypothetical protein
VAHVDEVQPLADVEPEDTEPVALTDPEDLRPVPDTEPEDVVPAEIEPQPVEPRENERLEEPVFGGSWAHADDGWAAAAVADAFGEAAPLVEREQPQETSYEAPEPVIARTDDAPAPGAPSTVEDAPVRLQIRRPLSDSSAPSPLEAAYVAEHDESSDDSTIFGQLRSNWLNDEGEGEDQTWVANEVDTGWNAAARVETTDADGTTRAGLPVRRPGGRLLPGGVSQEPAKVDRDPEIIRNRLAAHAAGVSRGRAAAAAEPIPEDYAHKETDPA